MKKTLWPALAIFLQLSCSRHKTTSPLPEEKKQKTHMLNLMTHLMNLQTYGFPIISTNISSDGKTVLVERLDHKQRVIREDLYFEGKIVSTAQFIYDDKDHIIETLNYDNEGNLILYQQFMYHPDDSLWQIFQQNQTSLYQKNQVYTDNRQNTLVVDYYQHGMLSSTLTYHAQILDREKNYSYKDGYLVKKFFKNLQDMTERVEYYNQDQILTAVTFLRDNQFIEHEEYFYQDKKLISKTVEDQEGQISRYDYQYDENGVLTKSDLYQDNTLRQSTIYLPDGKYIIEYYAFGQVRMSELYENNVLVEQNINETAVFSEEDFLD